MTTVVADSTRRVVLTGGGLAAYLAVAHIATDSVTGMFPVLLPTFQNRFDLSGTRLALLVVTLSLSVSISQPLFGALADRLGRRRVAGLGIIISSSLLSLVAVAPTLPLLFGLLLVGGLGSAAFHPAGTSMARAADERRKALGVSLFNGGGTLGVALGPVIVLILIATLGVGRLQEAIGIGPAMGVSYLAMIPGAIIAFSVLARHRAVVEGNGRPEEADSHCTCMPCECAPCPHTGRTPAMLKETDKRLQQQDARHSYTTVHERSPPATNTVRAAWRQDFHRGVYE